MKDVLIVEDERLAANQLMELIAAVAPDLNVVAIVDNVNDAVEALRTQRIDLIMLDIHLGDDHSFSIFEKMDVKVPIIFTTAYDQYAIKAFKLNSIDYLLKPIQKEELEGAILKWRNGALGRLENIDLIIENMHRPDYRKRMLLSVGQHIRSIKVEEIACFYADQRYSAVLLRDGRKMIASETLEEIEATLNPADFFRINRKAIVRFDNIQNMVKYSRSRTKLELNPMLDFELIVSVERAHDFLAWLNR